MLRNWRAWVLVVLFAGPIVAYMGFGTYWLYQKGWAIYAFGIWVTMGLAFSYLASRWTKNKQALLPPLDWESPETFNNLDRLAWKLVEDEANRADEVAMAALSDIDVYIETGKRLTNRLAAHYHPLSHDPIENVPIVELLAALELAAEDLERLCRQIPGGDLVTYGHWKQAIKYSGMLSKANEIYGYLLPIFQPVTGLVRLGTQKLMVQPAWKDMQQNVLRWFFRAYVNRLGMHLIELYSGRLTIGSEGYRLLTRKRHGSEPTLNGPGPLVIVVAGARDVGKTKLIDALRSAAQGDLTRVAFSLERGGFDPILADRLRTAEWVEVPGYTVSKVGEKARDRATRREAVDLAADADLLLLILDGRRDEVAPEQAFMKEWEAWFAEQKVLDPPPAVAALATFEPEKTNGSTTRALSDPLRARVAALRAVLPAAVVEIVPIGLGTDPPSGVSDILLPAIAPLLHAADRASMLRHLRKLSTRSRARRLLSQVGRQGRSAWMNLKNRGAARTR